MKSNKEQQDGKEHPYLSIVPPIDDSLITAQSDALETAHPDIMSKMLTVHTAESFQKFMDNFTSITDILTAVIDKKSEDEGDISLAEKNLSWQVGLYPMLVTDSAGKIRVKVFVRPTLAKFIDPDRVGDIRSYRDIVEYNNTYKGVYVPVYNIGNDHP